MPNLGASMARALSDNADRLVEAEEPLARLQLACGGDFPGTIAILSLLETVRKSRRYGLKLARTMTAQDGTSLITAWVEVEPSKDGGEGCEILMRNWRSEPLPPESPAELDRRRHAIERQLAELVARLDASQNVLVAEAEAPELASLAEAMRAGAGKPWTDFVGIDGSDHHQPLHWRLLDGAKVTIADSQRTWRATLIPQLVPGMDPAGFELLLSAEEPVAGALALGELAGTKATVTRHPAMVGRDIAPVLRLPIARIIANAETIRTRMAGPLADDYAGYAADIAAAGQHLLGLLDDLSDLEVVEAESFDTAPDRIDLADVARQAAGILGVRARERGIIVDGPRLGETLPAVAEFRRVLQILLNLVGNAISYSPEGSQIWVRLEDRPESARVIVADQGPGLSDEQQARVFRKFERLGRSNDGGSGLGLYISRRLARAMQGELTVESAPGQGARFILDLPRDGAQSPLPPPPESWPDPLAAFRKPKV